MTLSSIPDTGRPTHLALAISAALFVISAGTTALERLAPCAACATHQGPWASVAPLGAAGYAALTAIGVLGRPRLFATGTAVAAGIHTALILAMLARGRFCTPCALAAAMAGALFATTLARSRTPGRMFAFAYLPAVLLASGPVAWALAREQASAREREHFVRAPRAGSSLSIAVFEQDHCGYCRDFRDLYLPRLEREFGSRIRVDFHAAASTAWVRRTPTIVIEGGPVYEGLPPHYLELRRAVEEALAAREAALQ